MFIEFFLAVTAGFLVTLFLRFFYRKIKIHDQSIYLLSLKVFVLAFLGGNLTVLITTLIGHLFIPSISDHAPPFTFKNYLAPVVSWTIPIIGWSALYFGLKFWQEWKIQKEKADMASAQFQAAQFQLLRYRMNPHFLFNTLNSIRALISENKASAKKMVTELSDYLRYSLVSRNYANVPLRDELESIRHYFNIQKIRYENKLDISFDIDPESEEFPILSFLLHPLAENAVKYGMRTSPMPLKIRISSRVQQNILQIDIINSGSWIKDSNQEKLSSYGSGLNNIRQRLEDAYSGKHHLEILEEEGFVDIRLTIEENKLR